MRRAATGILPSRRIQDFLGGCSRRRSTTYIPVGVSINDGRGEFWLSQSPRAFLFRLTWSVQPLRVTRCVYPPIVIPAKAGIQETRPGDKWIAGFIGWLVGSLFLWLSFPRYRNGLLKPLDSGLRRAATGILGGSFPTPLYRLRPVGVPSRRIQDFLSINDGRVDAGLPRSKSVPFPFTSQHNL